MKRIAVIVGKMDSGGKKNLIMEYYRNIDREKIQFDFICDADSQAIPLEEIELLGGRVYIVSPYQNIIKNMIDMYKIFKKNNYRIMHAYNSTMNLFPLIIAKIVGVPVRISESLSMAHEKDWKTLLKKLLKPFSRLFATHYMSCGEDCGRWQFGNKAFDNGEVDVFRTVVNTEFNAYDSRIRKKTREKYGWEENVVIGHIGRFTLQKNSIRMIDIFAEVVKLEPKAMLCLIGDGELRRAIMDRIKELDIGKNVCYFGRREDIQQFYNAMDCFLLPSLYEGLPVVGLEAASCGLPIIFSTEITREADACGLCKYISLDESNSYWAKQILNSVDYGNNRYGFSKKVEKAGFDSGRESKRLQQYYLNAIEDNL